jgi:hypothetical protein
MKKFIAFSCIACIVLGTSMTPKPGSTSLHAPAYKPLALNLMYVAQTEGYTSVILRGRVATDANALTETVYVAITAAVLAKKDLTYVITDGKSKSIYSPGYSPVNPLFTNSANDLVKSSRRLYTEGVAL